MYLTEMFCLILFLKKSLHEVDFGFISFLWWWFFSFGQPRLQSDGVYGFLPATLFLFLLLLISRRLKTLLLYRSSILKFGIFPTHAIRLNFPKFQNWQRHWGVCGLTGSNSLISSDGRCSKWDMGRRERVRTLGTSLKRSLRLGLDQRSWWRFCCGGIGLGLRGIKFEFYVPGCFININGLHCVNNLSI